VGARLASFKYELDENGVGERRVRITIIDSRGQRLVHDAMEQPGTVISKEVRAYGPAKLSIKVGDDAPEMKDLP
jgi:hypothetical protein